MNNPTKKQIQEMIDEYSSTLKIRKTNHVVSYNQKMIDDYNIITKSNIELNDLLRKLKQRQSNSLHGKVSDEIYIKSLNDRPIKELIVCIGEKIKRYEKFKDSGDRSIFLLSRIVMVMDIFNDRKNEYIKIRNMDAPKSKGYLESFEKKYEHYKKKLHEIKKN